MSFVKMKKLRLLALKSESEALLRELQGLGCLEVSEQAFDDEESCEQLKRETTDLLKYKSEYTEVLEGLKLLDKYAPVKAKLLAPRPNISREVFLDETELEESLETANRLRVLGERIRRINEEENRQRGIIESLLPWKGLELPLELAETETCAVIRGTVPVSVSVDDVESALAEASEEAAMYFVSADKSQCFILFVCLKEGLPKVLEALRNQGYSPSPLSGMTGTVRENIDAGEKRLKELEAEKLDKAAQISAEAATREKMKRSADRLGAKISLAEAQERLICTEAAALLTGWVSEPDIDKMREILANYDCAWETEEPAREEYPEVPVRLKNGPLSRCMNMVTEMYSLPAYGSIDPNPLMAPFFILIYGIMMADMGYGLLMLIAGLVVKIKMKPRDSVRNFLELMIYCGISTIVFGGLTGGFFGDFIPQILRLINPESTFEWFWPPLFNPLEDTVMILLGSMALGFVHIVTGMAISFVHKAKNGRIMDGIWDEGTWWVIFAGIALMALDIGTVSGYPVVLLLGILMLVVGSSRNAKGIGKVLAVFDAVYSGVTGFFGDILSYSRLMALMLAGSVIAQVFNTIGSIMGNIVVFLIVSLFGNTLNFGLNLLGCFIHDLRLQCLEYFGKFYEDGGRAFKPLTINTKYVDIVKE